MKFSLLAVGQQFEYQGETYIKSTPLIAHHVETGEPKLIPRSATVVIADTGPGAAAANKQSISVQDLQKAFARFEAELQDRIVDNTLTHSALADAKQNFFQRLGITLDK